MNPTRELASSRPKPRAPLKKPNDSCPFAAPCGPRKKKKVRSQTSAFPSETSLFAPLILAHGGSALRWLVGDRAAPRLLRRIWCVQTQKSTARLSATVFPASRVPPHLPKETKLELGRGVHLGTPSSANHTAAASQPTGRIAKAASWLDLLRVSPALHLSERPSHTHTPKPDSVKAEGSSIVDEPGEC